MTAAAPTGLDGSLLRRWLVESHAAVTARRSEIDALNVFPVPDGDTGSNLALTLDAVVRALAAGDRGDLGTLAAAAAQGAVEGARGSSGLILSQLLLGFASDVGARPSLDAAGLRSALAAAADHAERAVADPVEGTILSVARAAAVGAVGADLRSVAEAAATAAAKALARTPEQLPQLADAGVVDAGGQGLVVVLDALAVTLGASPSDLPDQGRSAHHSVAVCSEHTGPAYEVQYLLAADAGAADGLRSRLAEIGDAVVVSGAAGAYNVHVHVDDIGAAIEAGVSVGRPRQIRVTRFADSSAAAASRAAARTVAIAAGPGIAALFRSAGALVVEAFGHTPSTTELAGVIAGAGGDVVLLPNARDLHAAAHAAAESARADGRTVVVVPTRSPVQGLAAAAVHDADRAFDADAVAMSAAAAATRFARVVMATHDALTTAGPCRAGDVLGLIDDDVAVVGRDVRSVARQLVDRMLLSGGELVTLLSGQGLAATLAEEVAAHVCASRPALDAVVHDGGQPHDLLVVGVE